LTRPFDDHLDSDDLDALVSLPEGGEPSTERDLGEALAEFQRHAEACPECGRRVQLHRAIQSKMARLGTAWQPTGPDCAGDAEWLDVAAGLIPEEKAKALMNHSAKCGHCGPLLKNAVEALAREATPDEEAVLKSAESAQPEWQRRMARALRATLQESRRNARPNGARLFSWQRFVSLRLASAVAAMLVIAFGGWLGYRRIRTASVEQLLAEAYTEHRTLEVRIPGAKYAPMRVERGSSQSALDKPSSLLKAESSISEKLRNQPNDPELLSAKGRVDLLEGNSDNAISTLKKAVDLDPGAVSPRIDLASAYVQRAEASGISRDYGFAVEALSQVLKQHPDDATAVFNLSIVYGKLLMYDEAIREWQHYLELDPNGPWAAEAKSRLESLQQIMKKRQSSLVPITRDPLSAESVLTSLQEVAPEMLRPEQSAIEENLLQEATVHWIPNFALEQSSSHEVSSRTEWEALKAVSTLLVLHHRDSWMQDLVRSPRSIGFREGTESLAKAVQANQEGDSDEALRSGLKAVSRFGLSRNTAGQLRARFEALYALKRAQRGPECWTEASRLARDLANRSYAWLEIQTLLEQSICMYMVGDFEAARQTANAAANKAESARYPTLYLRSLGLGAGLATNKGDMASAWQLDLTGLGLYWSEPVDSLRAWQFYSDMGFAAEESSQWSLAVALARESVISVHASGRLAEEARARIRLATVATADGQFDEAADQFHSAEETYRSMPQTESVKAFEADGTISLAEVETERNELADALLRLDEVRPVLPKLRSYSIPLRYYKTLGRLHYLRGDDKEAENALSAALAISESGAQSFPSDNDRDLLLWQKEIRDLYRYFVELQLLHRKDSSAALQVWEWYRALPLRRFSSSNAVRHGPRSGGLEQPGVSFEMPQQVPSFLARKELRELPVSSSPDAVLISYAWLTDGLAIWVVDQAGVHSQWIPLELKAFERVAKRFVSECADSRSDPRILRSDGQQLFRWLMAPVEGYLHPANHIVIETDEHLSLIPFQALSDATGGFAGTRWTFLYSPGVAYRQISHPSSMPLQKARALVVGVTTVGGPLGRGLQALPDAGLEARAVAELFPGSTLLLDGGARREAVQDAMVGADVFHFAGHSIVSPQQQGLLLAAASGVVSSEGQDSGLLTTEDIRRLRLAKCQLIVLSACATASSEELFMDPQDLAGSFLRVGARTVVASRWSVDSATTREFMSTFFRALLANTDVPSVDMERIRAESRRTWDEAGIWTCAAY
jgi:CHAT domain-containing protein/tetratricopeptide (TPR) repeat protein